MVTYEMVKNDPTVKVYIQKAGDALKAIGFSEHSFAHVCLVAEKAAYIMESLGYSEREVELVKIAGYLHDIGNVVNRSDHSQSGAIMAFRILDRMGMDPAEISDIVMAIGNHDEGTGKPISPMAAALIIADKSDVRRSRVRDAEDTLGVVIKSLCLGDVTRDIHLHIDPAVEVIRIGCRSKNLTEYAVAKCSVKLVGYDRIHARTH